ncbi:hypothetical protein [Alicyclobacillus dauci]|uniref:Uncharacterized protein n=1 Tax=Alicyclobacillus dauci TaxID=1475485 RepID=A0ABY6YXL1_9BACL|nr:hypothetical protein [Alicyclobacillus dauci]WAH35282.1 hypothetical protein NZD86_13285 [Alicyclobacillus dauci]
MRKIRHESIESQAKQINQVLQGHYAYYRVAGNMKWLLNMYQATRSLK